MSTRKTIVAMIMVGFVSMTGIASENGDILGPEGLLPERDYKPDEIIVFLFPDG
jgi:hypothetical protein